MTIIGCDCDAKLCEYIGETPAQWTSVADCEAAMKSQVLKQRNLNYPLISGICRDTSPPDAQLTTASVSAVQAAAPLPEGLRRRPSAMVGSPATAADTAAVQPLAYADVTNDGQGLLYRTERGYAVVKTSVTGMASGAIGATERAANWLSQRIGF